MVKKKFEVPHEINLDNLAYIDDENDGNRQQQKTDTSKSDIKVKRTVGLTGGISLIVGTMIGSGIFASASSVSSNSGSVGMSLVVWAGCGALAMCGALCYIELGLMIPISGGEYSYLKEAFGDLPAFLYIYTSNLLLKPAGVAAIVVASGDYIVEPFYGSDCVNEDKIATSKLLATLFLGLIVFVNCASTRWATNVQIVFTVAKLGAIVIIIATGLARLGQGYNDNFKNAFDGTTTRISDIGYAFFGGLWAYDGWNNLNYVTEELANPIRDLPLSIMIGIPLVTSCYVLMNIAYLTVLTAAEVSNSSAVAVTVANRMYGVMAWIIPVLVACSTFGAANGAAFTGGRLVFASAREGHMPGLLAMVHKKRNTPLPGLVFSCIISCIMIMPESSNFDALITYFNFAAWIFYGATFAALIWLRFKKPEMKRPYKVWIIIPIVMLLCSIYLVAAPFVDYPLESTYCTIFILTGIPVYLCVIKYQLLPASFIRVYNKIAFKLEALMDVVMPVSEDAIPE
ncbi:b(0,+)-type amino acid transporter 1-like [Hydractinia symbiolongicarpus]|uniref:b(0,+)-type amino acid transporter 1-like n=1 Tax=Hydractinia symbiolongicarpus TaxID=13093 RepID=UPI00254D3F71|nr:b(0,+)-type amino acid transporter 1-like [Hydractinia symbiolongicarpus]